MVKPTALNPAAKKKLSAWSSSDGPSASPSKRTKSRAVFVRAGKIYDSEHGKTCHQCRQKTMAFSASCKNDRAGKQCFMHFCRSCLLNRYGESAETAVATDGWSCPKCRGICNCSFCMKKRGQQPTGILAPLARSSGFSSVSQMLQQEGLLWLRGGEEGVAGPIDVEALLELERRREEERDREIEVLKAEIAAMEAVIGQPDRCRA